MPAWATGAWKAGAWNGTAWAVNAPIQVPDVVGLTEAQGTSDLEAVGFVVAVTTAYSSSVAAGLIISQDPVAGSTPGTGATVTITVSLGEAPVEESGGGGWAAFLAHMEKRDRRRHQHREDDEDVAQLPDPVSKEIAQILHKQEREDERRADLDRLKVLVNRFNDEKAEAEISERLKSALNRARQRQTDSSLKNLERELRRDEEQLLMTVLMLMVNTDD